MSNITDRDRLTELLIDSETKYAQYLYEECDKAIKGDITKQLFKRLEFYADYLLANGVIVPPCKVGDLPDRIFSHNSVTAIWVEIPKEHCSQRLWRGMAWDIPEKYKKMQFKRIFGSVPENIYEGDTINVLVELTKEEAEKALKEKK